MLLIVMTVGGVSFNCFLLPWTKKMLFQFRALVTFCIALRFSLYCIQSFLEKTDMFSFFLKWQAELRTNFHWF